MTKLDTESKAVLIKTILIVSSVLILFGGWLWWHQVYNSPKSAFNNMINNSLSTLGYTKVSKQDNENGNFEQLTQIQFGEQNIAEIKSTIKQKTDNKDTKVVTNTVATPRDNYVKYSEISVPEVNGVKPDFSKLVNIWGKQSEAEQGQSVFYDAVYGAVLVANIPSASRSELIDFINQNNFYKIDYSKVGSEKVNNRDTYVYDAEINLENYIKLLQKFDKISGLKGTEGVDIASYKDSPPINVKIYVDKRSHLLSRIVYDQSQDFTYSGYGIRKTVDIPEQAITRQELEDKLQQTLGQ